MNNGLIISDSLSAYHRLSPKVKQHAHKLRLALASSVELHFSGRWGRPEIESAGLRDYKAVFGHSITPRHFWRILDGVLAADEGRRDFKNLAIYLPGKLTQKKVVGMFDRYAKELPSLTAAVAGIKNLSEPTEEERLRVWDSAFSDYQNLVTGGMADGAARRRVLAALDAGGVPLARTRAALRRSFCYKLGRWIEGGQKPDAIRDLRSVKCGRKRKAELTPDDLNKLTARALHLRSVPAAWRELLQTGELSAGVTQNYISNTASKSYCPEVIRAQVAQQVDLVQDIHHGPRQAKLNGPHVTRDWSDTSPGDWQQADDVTLEIYYWLERDGVPQVMRGQFLLMIDLRSLRILNYALHSENNYNATVIRGLMLRTHDSYGMPRKGYYYEKGMWKSARLVKGRDVPTGSEIEFEQTENGFRDFGMEFRHANLPRGKPVERVIGLLQAKLRDQPGWVGPNEIREKFERVQKLLLQARSGAVHPSAHFLHRDEWNQRLQEICDDYNNEPQQGRMLRGLSPRQFWDTHFDYSRPLMRLGAHTRYLLANHRRPEKVGTKGVKITVGKQSHWFISAELGNHVGKTVQVYFDPEDMRSVFVLPTMSSKAVLVVPAAPTLPAMTATPDQMRQAAKACDDFIRPARTVFAEVKKHFPDNAPSPFRHEMPDAATLEMGREIAEGKAAIESREDQREQAEKKVKRLSRKHGVMRGQDRVSIERLNTAYQILEEKTDAQT